MDVSIILCTYDRAQRLAVTLGDLLALEAPAGCEWEIVVVDNNSHDDTAAVVKSFVDQYPGRIRYLFEPLQGKSFALNQAVRQTEGESLFFTDDDVRVDRGWMKALLTRFEEHSECIGIGGRLVPVLPEAKPIELDEEEIRRFHSFDFGEKAINLKESPFGGNMAYRRDAFLRYGFFRTDLGPTGFDRGGLSEDSEFARRLMDSGESICYEPEAVVHHPVQAERLTVQYLDHWHFQYGRALWRREEHPTSAPSVFSMPLYLLRLFLGRWLQWIATVSPKERRHRRWKVELLRGQIHEARYEKSRPENNEVESV